MDSRVRTLKDRSTTAIATVASVLACAAPAAAQSPPVVEPPGPGTSTVTRGFDLAHTFFSAEPAATPPLGIAWTADFDGSISSPLVADGRVFLSVSNGEQYGAKIVALAADNGRELWRTAIDTVYFSAYLGYGDGRLIAADAGGKLHALDPATGREQWVTQVSQVNSSYPIVAGGLVYLQGNDHVDVFDAASGTRRFQAGLGDGTNGTPAISGDRLYVLGPCRAAAFDRRNGNRIWLRDDEGCTGGGGAMATLFGRRVTGGDFFLDAETGARVAGRPPPRVVAGDVGITRTETGIEARDLATGDLRWASAPKDEPSASPSGDGSALAAAGNTVLWLRGSMLRALDRATGAVTWAGRFDPAVYRNSSHGGIDDDMAIGSGIVLVPAGRRLWALSNRAPEPAPKLVAERDAQGPVEYGSATSFSATVTTTGLAPAFRVELQRDAWPFGRFTTQSAVTAERGKQLGFESKPSRNTRYRLAVAGTGIAESFAVVVLPRVTSQRLDRRPGPRGVILLRVSVPRAVRLAGRPIYSYLYRAGAKRYDRLGGGRLHGRRGRYTARFGFRTVSRFGKKGFIAYCVRGLYRRGMSFGDRLDRRCGARRVRR